MIQLTVRQQLLQAAHEEAHPGKRCAQCPEEVVRQVALHEWAMRQQRSDLHDIILQWVAVLLIAGVLLWAFTHIPA